MFTDRWKLLSKRLFPFAKNTCHESGHIYYNNVLDLRNNWSQEVIPKQKRTFEKQVSNEKYTALRFWKKLDKIANLLEALSIN